MCKPDSDIMRNHSIDEAKSYATQKNLENAIRKNGWADHRKIIVRNSQGRWTAIFPASNLDGGYIGLYSDKGFMTLG